MKRLTTIVAVIALLATSAGAEIPEITKAVGPNPAGLGTMVTVLLNVSSAYEGTVTDYLPSAFTYKPDSRTVNGAPVKPIVKKGTVSVCIPPGCHEIRFKAQVVEVQGVDTVVANMAVVEVCDPSLGPVQACDTACITLWKYCGFHKHLQWLDPRVKWEPPGIPIIPMYTDVHFHVGLWVRNLDWDGIEMMESIKVNDRLAGDLELEGDPENHGVISSSGPAYPPPDNIPFGWVDSYTTGKAEKVHWTWTVDESLADGEVVWVLLHLSTDINPGQDKKKPHGTHGKNEYTEPCYHELNSGAVLKFIDPATGNQLSAHTPPIIVKVVPPQ
ncbi:MAG: hypothetical protein JW741_15090 [Sedimentisphaerales bacterium]|nr:hypothetical protein [Sedimentisphaerales bacterium]